MPGTNYVDQPGFKLAAIRCSVSRVPRLRIKACVARPGVFPEFKKVNAFLLLFRLSNITPSLRSYIVARVFKTDIELIGDFE